MPTTKTQIPIVLQLGWANLPHVSWRLLGYIAIDVSLNTWFSPELWIALAFAIADIFITFWKLISTRSQLFTVAVVVLFLVESILHLCHSNNMTFWLPYSFWIERGVAPQISATASECTRPALRKGFLAPEENITAIKSQLNVLMNAVSTNASSFLLPPEG
jgi:hypothetical protein